MEGIGAVSDLIERGYTGLTGRGFEGKIKEVYKVRLMSTSISKYSLCLTLTSCAAPICVLAMRFSCLGLVEVHV